MDDTGEPLLGQGRRTSVREACLQWTTKKRVWIVILASLVVAITILAVVIAPHRGASHRGSFPPGPHPSPVPPLIPSPSPTSSPKPPKPPKEKCEWSDIRLPDWAAPNEYRLDLDVEMVEPFAVKGRVEIGLEVKKSTRCVVLHSLDMEVTAITAMETGEQGSHTADKDLEILVIEFPSKLPTPNATIALEFSYKLGEGPHGFFKSETIGANGEAEILAHTEFKSTHARKAFPCFDEPALKAKFAVNVTVPTGFTCLGNMPEISTTPTVGGGSKNQTKHIFQTSPRMSTFLAAWVIAKDVTSVGKEIDTLAGKKPFKIWTHPHNAEELQPALDMIAAIVPFYENLFGLPYSLPKLDFVSLPKSTKPSPTENWGLVTCQASDLLLSREDSSSKQHSHVALEIARSISHMWFGDLVSAEFWGDAWLSEGFSEFLQYLGADIGLAGLGSFDRFFSTEVAAGLDVDGASFSHALSVGGADLFEGGKVRDLLDGITRKKGASVLRMLWTYVQQLPPPSRKSHSRFSLENSGTPTDPFMKSLGSFLDRNKFKNVNSSDLWSAVEDSTGLAVADWMKQWTYESGFPEVGVGIDPETKSFYIGQYRHGENECREEDAWWIPVHYKTKGSPKPKWVVLDSCAPLLLDKVSSAEDVPIVNLDRLGNFRVRYSPELMSRVRKEMKIENPGQSEFSAIDMAGVLEETYSRSTRGDAEISEVMELVETMGFRRDEKYAPWEMALAPLWRIKNLMESKDPDCAKSFTRFVAENVTGPMLSKIFSGEPGAGGGVEVSYDVGMLRELIMYESFRFGHQTVVEMGMAWLEQRGYVDPNFRKAFYSAGVTYGGEKMYEKILAMFFGATQVHEKERLLIALASSPDPKLVNKTLEMILTDHIPPQDAALALYNVAKVNSKTAETAFEFIKSNHETLLEKLGSRESLSESLMHAAEGFASPEKRDELGKCFERLSEELVRVPYLDQALRSIDDNRNWLEKNQKGICDWLNEGGRVDKAR